MEYKKPTSCDVVGFLVSFIRSVVQIVLIITREGTKQTK